MPRRGVQIWHRQRGLQGFVRLEADLTDTSFLSELLSAAGSDLLAQLASILGLRCSGSSCLTSDIGGRGWPGAARPYRPFLWSD